MRKIQLDEPAVIAMYEQVENTREVAEAFNVCDETIRRLLKRNGISRTHRHESEKKPKVKKSHCHSKYCPALIVMLHKAFGWSAKGITEATGYTKSGVQNILKKRGFVADKTYVNKADYDLDQIEREYLAGATSYELGERYGVNHATISKWMRKRGIHMGKGNHQRPENRNGAGHEFVYSERMQEINQLKHEEGERRFIENLERYYGGRFEYVGGFRDGGRQVTTVRCVACGHEFEHGTTDMGKKDWRCPQCDEVAAARRDVVRSIRRIASLRERTSRNVSVTIRRMGDATDSLRRYLVDRECVICGSTFHSDNPRHLCCSKECSRKYSRKVGRGDFHRHRARRYNVTYDSTITLRGVFLRDGGVCQICGGPCDWNDREYGDCGPTYPSVDHIVPFAAGGAHTWGNVQLAHFRCNSRKGARTDVETIREAVAGG